MYNGIGLPTPRGSGTNGYVQRNLSSISASQTHQKYKTDEEIKKAEAIAFRGPNPEILEHQRKRQIELQCIELEELMEEQGFGTDEIEEKVAVYRLSLTRKQKAEEEKMANNPKAMLFGTKLSELVVDPETGRPTLKNSHEIAAAKMVKNAQFKDALGLTKDYVDGSSFERARVKQAKKEEEEMNQKTKELMQKEFLILEDSSSSESESGAKKKSKKKKEAKKSKKSKKLEKKRKHQKSEESSDENGSDSKRKKANNEKMRQKHDKEATISQQVRNARSRPSQEESTTVRSSRRFREEDDVADSHRANSSFKDHNAYGIKDNRNRPRRNSSSSSDHGHRQRDLPSRDREANVRGNRDPHRRSRSASPKIDRRREAFDRNDTNFESRKRKIHSPARQDESNYDRYREVDRKKHFSQGNRNSPRPSPPRSRPRKNMEYIGNRNPSPHSDIKRSESSSPEQPIQSYTRNPRVRRSRSRSKERRR